MKCSDWADLSSPPFIKTPNTMSPRDSDSPPPVDAHIGGAREPGVEDVDAADGVGAPNALLQGGVVVEPEPLSEPVHRVHPHPGHAAGGGSPPSSSTERFKARGSGSSPTPPLPGESPHPREEDRAAEGGQEKMSLRSGPERERALEAPLGAERRLPGQPSPGVTPFRSRHPPQPPGGHA